MSSKAIDSLSRPPLSNTSISTKFMRSTWSIKAAKLPQKSRIQSCLHADMISLHNKIRISNNASQLILSLSFQCLRISKFKCCFDLRKKTKLRKLIQPKLLLRFKLVRSKSTSLLRFTICYSTYRKFLRFQSKKGKTLQGR